MTPNNLRNGSYQDARGLVETKGLIAPIAATDAMCKAANVALAGQGHVGSLAHRIRGGDGGDQPLRLHQAPCVLIRSVSKIVGGHEWLLMLVESSVHA